MASPILEANSMEKTLGSTPILHGIDLAIDREEIVVIIGPNGAGKTILLCCLAGGLELDSGSVTIDGRPLPSTARRDLSFLPQESMAIEHLTGRENGRFYSRLHPSTAGRWRQMATRLGLDGDLDSKVRTYSGGMTRKLELAIALDPDVPLYLFDEPTAGVDLTKITQFHDLLLTAASNGKTVVLSSHTPLDMELADTIVVVRDGRLGGIGQPEALLEALPDILRVRGRIGQLADDLRRHVLEGRWYVRGDEIRGFLRLELDPARVQRSLSDEPGIIDVSVEAPSFVDLFNYHTDEALIEAGDSTAEVTPKWK